MPQLAARPWVPAHAEALVQRLAQATRAQPAPNLIAELDRLVGDVRGQRIVVLQLDARGMTVADETVDLPSTRTRALVQGPDGNLYTANDDGEIWQVVPN